MADEQQLFLMEFLVDRVNIPVVRAIHEELLPADTCVSFQILSLPPINIYQESPTDGCACNEGDTQIFKKGKSCLFALPSVVLQKPLTSFPVNMSVYKKLPPGVLPDVMLIGSHQIETKDMMNSLLTTHIFKTANPCKTMKDTFKIKTATGQCVGDVTVFLRASCFGKKIVTQFQVPHNRKPYLFKGADNSPVFQCKRIPSTPRVPAPVKCTCSAKKSVDGSGEAVRRTCCPTPSPQVEADASGSGKQKQLDWEPRPCCPSHRSSAAPYDTGERSPKCPLCSTHRQDQQVAHPEICPPCCSAESRRTQHLKSSGSCATPRRQLIGSGANCTPRAPTMSEMKKDSCPACCGTSYSPIASKGYKVLSDLLSKEVAVRKCGCAIKEEQSCNCARTK